MFYGLNVVHFIELQFRQGTLKDNSLVEEYSSPMFTLQLL